VKGLRKQPRIKLPKERKVRSKMKSLRKVVAKKAAKAAPKRSKGARR
jgi:hypothetical protein